MPDPLVRRARRLPARVRALLAAAAIAFPSATLALDGYLTLASGHVWRGVVLRDGPTLLLGASHALGEHWSFGAWGAGVDRSWPFAAARGRVQLGGWLARDGRCGQDCRLRASLSRYLYPGSDAGGWTEFALALRWRERWGLALASARHDGTGRHARSLEVFAEQPLGAQWSAEVLLGHSRYAGFGYRHASLELRRPWQGWQLGVAVHRGQTLPPDAPLRSHTRLVLSLGRGFRG